MVSIRSSRVDERLVVPYYWGWRARSERGGEDGLVGAVERVEVDIFDW